MSDRKNQNIDVSVKKHGKKRVKVKLIKRLNAAVCFLTILTISICMLVLKRPKISEIENRTLAKWPEFSFADYFSGKYTSGIENFYNDTVPGRETFKNMTAAIRNGFGFHAEEVKIHGTPVKQDTSKKSNSEKKKESETKPPETTAPVSAVVSGSTVTSVTRITTSVQTTVTTEEDPLDDPNIEGEISNSILVYKNRGIMLYGGSYSNGESYAEYVSNFKRDLGINVYSLVCPTPVSYYLPKKYEDMTASEKDNIDNINENLDGVVPIDAYGALMNHKKEDIFKRTDHHWSQLGAYYAAEEFAKQAGVPFADLSSYEKVEKDGYVGTLYGYSGDSDLKDNPEKFIYYKPTNKYTTTYYTTDMSEEWEGNLLINLDNVDPVSWYLVFMGTDDVVTHVHTDVGNGRKLAIVKDSYGNALVPCLTSSFEDIYVVDMRYFDVNAVWQFNEWGITDLLFAMNTFSATCSNFECIEQIRTQ